MRKKKEIKFSLFKDNDNFSQKEKKHFLSTFSFKKNSGNFESKNVQQSIRKSESGNNRDNKTLSNMFDGKFGAPQDMKSEWGLNDDETKIKFGRRSQFVPLLVAIGVFVFVLLAVFVVLPKVLPELFKGSNIELFAEKDVNLEYDDSYRVVLKPVENIKEEPDVKSKTISQVLYNEPVQVRGEIEDSPQGDQYIKIGTNDGLEGYVRCNSLSSDMESVEPDKNEYKLVISDTYKNIMTHATNGTLITRVMMNTVLYGTSKGDNGDTYEVSLPDGGKGWIGSAGVVALEAREELTQVSTRYFVSSALTFVNAIHVENGITMNGASIDGILYVSANVNGIKVPRTLELQRELGVPVEVKKDEITGRIMISDIKKGDIVFLRTGDSEEANDMAICTDEGTLLVQSKSKATIRLVNFKETDEICDRIVEVRRIFR